VVPDTNRHLTFVRHAETLSVSVSLKGWKLKLDTCYSCKSPDLIREGAVNQTLFNVLVQAFVANGSKSAESKCIKSIIIIIIIVAFTACVRRLV